MWPRAEPHSLEPFFLVKLPNLWLEPISSSKKWQGPRVACWGWQPGRMHNSTNQGCPARVQGADPLLSLSLTHSPQSHSSIFHCIHSFFSTWNWAYSLLRPTSPLFLHPAQVSPFKASLLDNWLYVHSELSCPGYLGGTASLANLVSQEHVLTWQEGGLGSLSFAVHSGPGSTLVLWSWLQKIYTCALEPRGKRVQKGPALRMVALQHSCLFWAKGPWCLL